MTRPADVVHLQVDTTPAARRNLVANGGADDDGAGWAGDYNLWFMPPAPIARNGRCFVIHAASSGLRGMTATTMPVQGRGYFGIAFHAQALSVDRALIVRVQFYDALGLLLDNVRLWTGRIDTTETMVAAREVCPSAAVSASITFEAGAGDRLLIGSVHAEWTATTAGAPEYFPPEWTEVGGDLVRLNCKRGSEADGVETKLTPGTLTGVLRSNALDPAVSTVLRRGAPIRVRVDLGPGRVERSLWTGRIEYADVDYEEAKRGDSAAIINVVATDVARDLADAKVPFTAPGGFAEQVASAAARAGGIVVNSPHDTAGKGTLPSRIAGHQARDDNATAADWIRRACNTHGGLVAVSPNGYLEQLLETASATRGPTTLFTDGSVEGADDVVHYTGMRIGYGVQGLVNALDVTRINADETDDDGSKAYGPYVASASELAHGRKQGTLEITAGSPYAVAQVVLAVSATPIRFPSELRWNPLDALAETARVQPMRSVHVARSGLYDGLARVLNVEHEISATRWSATAELQPNPVARTTEVSHPQAGADTGPSDVTNPTPGLLSRRVRTAAIGINTGTETSVPYNVIDSENGIPYDDTNRRWTVPKDGRYLIVGSVSWAPSATGVRALHINVNGVQTARSRVPGHNTGNNVMDVTSVQRLGEGDVVSISVNHSAGATHNIQGARTETFAAVTYLGT